MKYSQAVTEDRRLVLLELLTNSGGYTANQHLLQSALQGFAHNVSMDVLRVDLAWLEEQGLVKLEQSGGLALATLTQRGLDVAQGNATVPGVKRPAPGE